jgi:hypothetical protein
MIMYGMQVRPEPVLRKALDMVEKTDRDYYYRCDQLKSMRQDLTVQRIHNEFTVRVSCQEDLWDGFRELTEDSRVHVGLPFVPCACVFVMRTFKSAES